LAVVASSAPTREMLWKGGDPLERGLVRGAWLSQRREMAGDAEEEDDSDDATVGRAGPGDGVVEAGVMAAGVKGAAHGGGHEGIHGDQA